MTTTTASPYSQLPQVGHIAALPSSTQQQPQAQTATSAAGRRSFRDFVEAMDDFNFDRRDVAGMRQVLQMQEVNRRAHATAPTPAVSNVASFAPQGPQPDVPVVRGWSGQPEAAPAASKPAAELPRLPTFAAGPSDDLPRLPSPGAANTAVPRASDMPSAELPRLQPSAGRPVAFMSFAPQQPQAARVAHAQTSGLPAQLQSPMVDQVRDATRAGQRPGLSDEMRARFAANTARRHAPVAPVPPKLMAQEARWSRDAWPASVSVPRADAAGQPTLPASTAQAGATDLPRLPTAN